MRNNFAKAYSNTAVESAVSEATPHKLVELLYEGALKNLNLGKIFIQQKNYEKKAEHLNKALSIIAALQAGVDLDKGKDAAENFANLYRYCYEQVFKASSKNDVSLIDEVIELIKPIAEAWTAMPDNIKRVSKEQLDRIGTI